MPSRWCATTLAMVALASIMAFAQGQQAAKSDKRPEPTITLTTKPSPAAAGATAFTVTAKDAAGKPITGADVIVELQMPPMPSMNMGEMKNKVTLKPAANPKVAAEGVYEGKGSIMMAGVWNVTISIKSGAKDVAESKQKLTVPVK